MRVSLSGEGVPSLRGKGTKNIEAYLKLLQAEAILQTMNRADQAQAKRLAEEAVALDPEYARAYTVIAAAIGNEVLMGVHENPREALERALALAEKAVKLDDSEEQAHRALGFIAIQLNRDYEKGIAEAERAVELAPNSVMAQYHTRLLSLQRRQNRGSHSDSQKGRGAQSNPSSSCPKSLVHCLSKGAAI